MSLIGLNFWRFSLLVCLKPLPITASSFTLIFCRGSIIVQIKISLPFCHLFSFCKDGYSPSGDLNISRICSLCIKGMINVIIDSHQKIFCRTAVLEISLYENIRSGAFLTNLKIPIEEPHQGCFSQFFQSNFSIGSLSFVYVKDDAP